MKTTRLRSLAALAAVLPASVFSRDTALAAQLAEVTNLRPICVEAPAIPLPMINAGYTSGEVKAIVEVSPDGRVSDFLVTSSTHEALARAAENALRDWEFAPTAEGDPAVIHQLFLTLRFSTSGFVVAQADPASFGAESARRHTYGPAPVAHLDQPLRPLAQVAPLYPADWKAEGVGGTVTVSYYIDGEGVVHVPTVRGEADPRLAAVAMDAIKQWRFDAPTVRGRPVFVEARQTFRFGGADAPARAERVLANR
jgi:TonB family protein